MLTASLMFKLAANFFQRGPARIFHRDGAGALFLVQILAAVQAQALAVFAASYFQRQRQQHLLAQNVLEQNSVALIIADFGFSVRHRKLVASGVGSEGAVEQFEVALYVLLHRLKAAGALQFEAHGQAPSQADVLNNLMLAVMLLDQFGASRGLQGRALAGFASQIIDDIGLKLLVEIDGTAFQVFDVEEHCEHLRGNVAEYRPAEDAKRALRLSSGQA